MVWTELSREAQDNIILRSQIESITSLAEEYKLLPQSLDRKIRKLKQSGLYDYIIQKNVTKPATKKIVVDNARVDPFVQDITSLTHPSLQDMTCNNDIVKIVMDGRNTFFLNPEKEWRGIFFTDLHCPYHDVPSINALLRTIKVLDHNILINGGDNLDLYGLSRYAKDSEMLFKHGFAGEVKAHNEIMESIAELSDAPKISLYGNHMNRYDLWLAQTPFMGNPSTNSSLSMNAVLSMNYYGWYDFAETIMFAKSDNTLYPKPTLIIDHGERVKTGATKSAASQFNAYGAVSYIMGHVHRLGVAYKRTLHGQHCIAEGGTLRGLNPEYIKYPDWTNGLLHFSLHRNVVTITPILIEGGIAYLGNTKL